MNAPEIFVFALLAAYAVGILALVLTPARPRGSAPTRRWWWPFGGLRGESNETQPAPTKRWRWQFGLRSLFVVTSLVCVTMSLVFYYVERGRKQQAAANSILKLGGQVDYDSEYTSYRMPLAKVFGHAYVGNVKWIMLSNKTGAPLQLAPGDLAALPSFRHLYGLEIIGVEVPESEYDSVSRCKSLQFLRICDNQFSNDNLSHLRGLSQLRMLSLYNTPISDEGLVHVRELKELDTLKLGGTQITDDGLPHLAKMVNLETLLLDKTVVTGVGLGRLEHLPRLRSVSLKGAKISDAGLVGIGRLRNLPQLTLDSPEVTDEGIIHLKNLRQLRSLDPRGTKVTADGVARLQESLPILFVDSRWTQPPPEMDAASDD